MCIFLGHGFGERHGPLQSRGGAAEPGGADADPLQDTCAATLQ